MIWRLIESFIILHHLYHYIIAPYFFLCNRHPLESLHIILFCHFQVFLCHDLHSTSLWLRVVCHTACGVPRMWALPLLMGGWKTRALSVPGRCRCAVCLFPSPRLVRKAVPLCLSLCLKLLGFVACRRSRIKWRQGSCGSEVSYVNYCGRPLRDCSEENIDVHSFPGESGE